MKLCLAKINSQVKIIGYNTSSSYYRRKLLGMGLTKGTKFTVIRKAPLGDPVQIRLRGYNLSLRKKEVEMLEVEVLDGKL
jgi:ferrous iron transport protein A